MESIYKKTKYQEFLEKDLDKYIKEYQEIKIFKLVVSEHFKKLKFYNNCLIIFWNSYLYLLSNK